MRTSREEKEKTSQRIVEGAARLVRARGIEATSVADVMNEAGLTHGGFYRHFDGKDALMVAALEAAFAEPLADLEQRFAAHSPAQAVAGYHAHYLDERHMATPSMGCPMPSLGGDVARASEALKASFSANVRRVMQSVARGLDGSPEEREAKAARKIAMLAGAIMLARACDPQTAADILAACREPSPTAE